MAVDKARKLLLEIQPFFLHVLQKALSQDDIEHRVTNRHCKRIAAKCRSVRSRCKSRRGFRGRQTGPDRESSADPLRHSHQVRSDTGPFIGKQLARASDTSLDFIKYEQQTIVVAQLAQRTQKLGLHLLDTAFTLNGFDRDRSRLRTDHRFQSLQVACRHLVEAWCFRAETFHVFGLATCRDSPECTTVKGTLECYDMEPVRMTVVILVATRALDGGFHRLGTGIHEKHLVCKGVVDQSLCQAFTFRHLVQVGNVPEFRCLVLQRLYKMGMTVPAGIHCNAGTAIEKSSAVLGNKPDTFPVIETQVRSCVISEKRSRGHNLFQLPRAVCIRCYANQMPPTL